MTTAILKRSAIEYPDSDGLPMSDNTRQFRWIYTIYGGIETLKLDYPDVFVAGNILWYPVEGEPTIRIGPDVLVAIGRPKGDRGSYRNWEEGNQAPQIIFEILSPGNRPGEMRRKLLFYQQFGVEEYYIYDPDEGTLEGWLRKSNRLIKIRRMAGFISPRLGIKFDPGVGTDNLRIYRPDGTRFLSFVELFEKSEADQRRAEDERRRADKQARLATAERQRADKERQRAGELLDRAERLAARLRELGIEPD
jgi:Uma2 family endonuclease